MALAACPRCQFRPQNLSDACPQCGLVLVKRTGPKKASRDLVVATGEVSRYATDKVTRTVPVKPVRPVKTTNFTPLKCAHCRRRIDAGAESYAALVDEEYLCELCSGSAGL